VPFTNKKKQDNQLQFILIRSLTSFTVDYAMSEETKLKSGKKKRELSTARCNKSGLYIFAKMRLSFNSGDSEHVLTDELNELKALSECTGPASALFI